MEPTTPHASPPPAAPAASDATAKIVYILYLVSLVVGVTAIIGVVIAYVNAGDAPEPLESHYRFQIRTFWIALLYGVVSFFLTFVVVGAIAFVFVAVWLIVRCAKGLRYLARNEPYPDAGTWLW